MAYRWQGFRRAGGYARMRMGRWAFNRNLGGYYGNRMRGMSRRRAYGLAGIASTPYLAGAAVGFTGIADSYIPTNFQNILMIAAVAPSGIMKGKLSMLKAVAQGYVIGRVVKGITGFGGINTASGVSGGPWL